MIYVDRHSFNIPIEESILCHYGDNAIKTLTFEIGESFPDTTYFLYISFQDGSINAVLLDTPDNNTAVWSIKAEHIFVPGSAHLQIKAISSTEEIWHSPKAKVEFLHSIDEKEPSNTYKQTLYEIYDNMISKINNNSGKDYIERSEVLEIIDELLLPLCQRLDGE